MITVYFHAQQGPELIEFKSTAATETEAKRQGFDWAYACGFVGTVAFLVTKFVPPAIHDITRKTRNAGKLDPDNSAAVAAANIVGDGDFARRK